LSQNKNMRIVTFKAIQEYIRKYPDSGTALKDWYRKTKESDWGCFSDIKQTFNSVDGIGNNRFVFNIKGNTYRLICIVIFSSKKVYIRFIGTHNEYERLNDCSIISK